MCKREKFAQIILEYKRRKAFLLRNSEHVENSLTERERDQTGHCGTKKLINFSVVQAQEVASVLLTTYQKMGNTDTQLTGFVPHFCCLYPVVCYERIKHYTTV